MEFASPSSFWHKIGWPKLSWRRAKEDLKITGLADKADPLERKPSAMRATSRGLKPRTGRKADQRQETMEIQQLLEITLSLIVNVAKLPDAEILGSTATPLLQSSDSKANLRYTLVEQMCTVDVARPIAVREGLLKVLVSWMRSKDREKIRAAATALRDLTSTLNKYMAG